MLLPNLCTVQVLRKADIVARQQVAHTNAERSIMEKVRHPFVVGLKCAFQTTHKLYMVMDFVQGGDMYTHLSRRGALRSSLVQLFTAEIVLALQVRRRCVFACVGPLHSSVCMLCWRDASRRTRARVRTFAAHTHQPPPPSPPATPPSSPTSPHARCSTCTRLGSSTAT